MAWWAEDLPGKPEPLCAFPEPTYKAACSGEHLHPYATPENMRLRQENPRRSLTWTQQHSSKTQENYVSRQTWKARTESSGKMFDLPTHAMANLCAHSHTVHTQMKRLNKDSTLHITE